MIGEGLDNGTLAKKLLVFVNSRCERSYKSVTRGQGILNFGWSGERPLLARIRKRASSLQPDSYSLIESYRKGELERGGKTDYAIHVFLRDYLAQKTTTEAVV